MKLQGKVLIIAGSDSGGGAGIQADIKAVSASGAYAATAITAITAQNTLGVQAIHPLPLDVLAQQIRSVLDDIGADVIKIGMLGTVEVTHCVLDVLADYAPIPIVLDPVMVAKGGAHLLDPAAVKAMKERLLPAAYIITPNIPEAEVLTDTRITSLVDMKQAAKMIQDMGVANILMKGGHLDSDNLVDYLLTPDGDFKWVGQKIDTRHTHGTGCTMASAIAAGLAQKMALDQAVDRAHSYVRGAIENHPGIGAGHGPLNHFWQF